MFPLSEIPPEKGERQIEPEDKNYVTDVSPCVTSCVDLADGNYHSCYGCDVYVTCKNGVLKDKRPCQPGWVFDADIGECSMMSETCDTGTIY